MVQAGVDATSGLIQEIRTYYASPASDGQAVQTLHRA